MATNYFQKIKFRFNSSFFIPCPSFTIYNMQQINVFAFFARPHLFPDAKGGALFAKLIYKYGKEFVDLFF